MCRAHGRHKVFLTQVAQILPKETDSLVLHIPDGTKYLSGYVQHGSCVVQIRCDLWVC